MVTIMDSTKEEKHDLHGEISRLGKALSKDHIEWDQRAEFPWDKWQLIRESGVLRLPFPKEYGGLDQDLCTTMGVLEELGYSCEDGGLNLATTSHIVSVGVPLLRFGTTRQKAKFLPQVCDGARLCAHAITESTGGSDAFNMGTVAEKRSDSFILNGSKTFITNASTADLFAIYALTDKSRGALGGATVFIVERGTPGFRVGEPIPKMGLKTVPLCELIFEDCEVPAENVVGEVGLGFPILDYVMKWEITCGYITSVGEMQRRLEKCIKFAKTRKQYGQPIGKYQSISNKIVDMKMDVVIARECLYRAARRVQRKENATIDLAIAKVVASENDVKSAFDAIRIFGGRGYMTEYGIEKDLRNSVAGTIYSGSSEIHRNRIARMLGI